MATRMQQRRGTAAQWTSANPVLNAGEMGWESDTNKFKIGDGTNHWADLDYFADINSTVNPAFGSSITFEGATADSYETVLQVTDPTADRTITLPNTSGTVITTGNLSDITNIGVFTSTITMEGSTADAYELTISAGDPTADRTATFPDATGTIVLDSATQTLTNKTLTTPVISSITNGAATLTLPTSTGTVALTTDIPAGVVTTSDSGTVTSTMIANGTITNDDINASAAIDKTKISGTAITAADTGTVTSTMIADGTIVDGDINASAAIAQSKIANLTTDLAAKASLSGATFTGAVAGTDLTLSGNLTVNGTTTNINSTNLVIEDKNVVLGDTTTPTDTTADGGGITLKGTTDKTFNWVDATDSWTSSEHINLASGKSYYMNGTALKDVTETLTGKTISGASNTLTVRIADDVSGLGTGIATFLGTPSSANLASAITDETGSGALVFGTSPSFTTSLTLNATAELRLADTDSSHYVGFKAPGTVTTNRIWTLPSADGSSGQFLKTDGSGALSWGAAGGGAAFSEFMLIGA